MACALIGVAGKISRHHGQPTYNHNRTIFDCDDVLSGSNGNPAADTGIYPIPTVLSILLQVICLILTNRIINSGVELSFLIPLNGAFSPLAMIFVGVFLYKEKASVRKIAVLLTACVLIGFANFL